MVENPGGMTVVCGIPAALYFAALFSPQPIEPVLHFIGVATWIATAFALVIWFNQSEVESERRRQIERENEEYNRKLNSPEEAERRRTEEAAKQKAFQELERQRLVKEEQTARAKWIQFHKVVRMDELDRFNGVEFERFLKTVLERRAFSEIRMTPASGDQGGDLVGLSPDGKKAVVQAKDGKGSSAIKRFKNSLELCCTTTENWDWS